MPLRRPLLATAFALLAFAAPAAASDGTYTAMVCANPDTGVGVATADGAFPDGVRMVGASHVNMTTLQSRQACAGSVSSGRGLVITTNGAYTLSQFQGAVFQYELPDELRFDGATLYVRTNTATGMVASVVRSASDWIYTSPRSYFCEQPAGCYGSGSAADPFGAANRVTVGTGHDGMPQGFRWFLRCAWSTCGVTNETAFALYGGRVAIGDDLAPSGTAVGGGLSSSSSLEGLESLSLTATDGQSGVYRARVLVDGIPQPWTVVSGGQGACRDVNFANGDDYEFAARIPCPRSTSGSVTLDTRAFPDGRHAVKVVVEDAAGNAATVLHRSAVTFDNFSAPVAKADPAVRGTARLGSTLAATAATWTNGGLAGDPIVARRWERCRRDGTQCTTIPGAADTLYEPTAADVGRRMRVVETATNAEGTTTSASASTDPVRAADGTLPPGDDGVDNDCDGTVDEVGEQATCPTDPTGLTATPTTRTPITAAPTPVPTTARSTAPGTVNGEGASPSAKLTAKLGKRVLDYGRTTSATGRLTDASGRPIRNAILDVAATAELKGAKSAAAAPVVTDADGAFTVPVTGKGGTRTITVGYRYQREGATVARADLRLTVRARVAMKVKLRGIVASYSGRVLAGTVPKGKLVIVQGRAKGGTWQTFASRRAARTGTFSGRYRLKVRRPGKRLQFRVRVLAESGWNYRGVTSKAVTLTVR